MRLCPPGALRPRFATVLPIAFLLFACGGAEESAEAPEPLAAAAASHADNSAPRIVSATFDPVTPVPGEAVRVVLDVVDDEGDPVKMLYDWTLAGQPAGSGSSKLMLRDATRGDALTVTVVASDGRAESEPMTVRGEVGNRPPRIERLMMGPALEISAGVDVEVQPEAGDEDGDELTFTYRWSVNGEPVDAEGPSFDTRALTKGDVVRVEVLANDGSADSDPLASPEIRVVNLAPRVTSRPVGSAADQAFRYLVEAEDPDGDGSFLFELVDAPDGMEIDASSGEITWRPRHDQSGTHLVHVVVDDQNGGRVSHAFEVAVGGAGPAAVSP